MKFSDERRANISAALRKAWTPEARARKSEDLKRQWAEGIRKPQPKGRKQSAEERAMRSRLRTGHKHSPETRAKIGAAHVGMKRSEEARANISAACLGRKVSPEVAAARSERMKLVWSNASQDKRAQMVAARRAGLTGRTFPRPTSIERLVHGVLDAIGAEYETEKQIGSYFADVFVPAKNLVIECDGEYWHSRNTERDAKRDAFMIALGYSVLRLPGKEIVSGLADRRVKEAVA
jgi:hypothetical protein